jgi:hypothetical protein
MASAIDLHENKRRRHRAFPICRRGSPARTFSPDREHLLPHYTQHPEGDRSLRRDIDAIPHHIVRLFSSFPCPADLSRLSELTCIVGIGSDSTLRERSPTPRDITSVSDPDRHSCVPGNESYSAFM